MVMIAAIVPVEKCPFSAPKPELVTSVPVELDPPVLRVLDPPVPGEAVGTAPGFARA